MVNILNGSPVADAEVFVSVGDLDDTDAAGISEAEFTVACDQEVTVMALKDGFIPSENVKWQDIQF